MTVQRRLIVMRHAKAEPYASTDHARRLTDRGRADARAAGRHLAAAGVVPSYAVVSTSERTRMTWQELAGEVGCEETVAHYDRAVYAGGLDDALEAIRAAPAETPTVMLVGHNPTAAYLGHALDDGTGDATAVSGLLRGFPPSALVVFEVSCPWAEVGPEAGRVVDFWAPPR